MASGHILIVDDEEKLVKAMADRLRLKGIIVDISFSGAEALKRLETCTTIDVVVLDIRMPGQNGMDTSKSIKATDPLIAD